MENVNKFNSEFLSAICENSETSNKNFHKNLNSDSTSCKNNKNEQLEELTFNKKVFITEYCKKYTDAIVILLLIYILLAYCFLSNLAILISLDIGCLTICLSIILAISLEYEDKKEYKLLIGNDIIYIIKPIKKSNTVVIEHTKCKMVYDILNKPFTYKIFGETERTVDINMEKDITSFEIPKVFSNMDKLYNTLSSGWEDNKKC